MAPIQRLGPRWTPEAPSMVSLPSGTPVLGFEGPSRVQNHLSWPSLLFPAELSRSFSEPRQPKRELYYCNAASPLCSGHCAPGGGVTKQ